MGKQERENRRHISKIEKMTIKIFKKETIFVHMYIHKEMHEKMTDYMLFLVILVH